MSMTITFKIKKFIIALKGSVHMKKPVALTLISIMVLMLSAFSFADDYSLEIVAPDDEVIVSDWDEPFLIKILVDASVGDELEKLVVTIDEEDGDYEYTFDKKVKHVFGEEVFEYTFEAPELTPMEAFKITVVAEFDNDVEALEASETFDVTSEAEDDEKEEEAGQEEEQDMYPAAPSIANKLLRVYGIPNRVNGVNLIAAVSEAMINGEQFDDADKDDAEYAENVEEFLIGKLNDVLDEELDDEIDELSDLEGFFDPMDKELVNHDVNKIKMNISDVEKVYKAGKNEDNDEDEEDDDDDHDDDDDDHDDDDHDHDDDDDDDDEE